MLALSIPSACALPSTMNELEDVVNVDVLEDEETAIKIKVQNGSEECISEEQYVLAELQKKPESLTEMHLLQFWVTLNKKATSVPTYAREGLEFLMSVAIAVVMVLFSGPH